MMDHEQPQEEWLRQLLEEEALPDEGFTEAVMGRVDHWVKLRRFLLGLTWLTAAIVPLLTAQFLGELVVSNDGNPSQLAVYLLFLLLSSGVCGGFWIEVEGGLSLERGDGS